MIYLPFTHFDFGVLIAIQVLALILDALLGEPRRFHPLIGFGKLIGRLEQKLNRRANQNLRSHGVVAWLLAVVPLTVICVFLLASLMKISVHIFWIVSAIILYFTIGLNSLKQHARWVAEPMLREDIEKARTKVAWLVSRDTEKMGHYCVWVCQAIKHSN